MEEKIKKFKSMTNEQLENIIYNPESSEEDVIIASIEKGHKDIKEGKYYTTEEIIEQVAKDDLQEIYNYIAKDSVYYAIKTTKQIINKTQIIKSFPYVGRKVQTYNSENIRELIYKSYKIIYEIDSKNIYIHRIFHSSRAFNNSILKIKK